MRCGYVWMVRTQKPKSCPKCKSYHFETVKPEPIPKELKPKRPVGKPFGFPNIEALKPGEETFVHFHWDDPARGKPNIEANTNMTRCINAFARRHGWKIHTNGNLGRLNIYRVS